MTRDDIIRMAREAGMERTVAVHKNGCRTVELMHPDLLVRFATLVAAAEREVCCQIVYGYCGSDNVAARTVEAIKARGI
jgi:hypothetical protein